MTNKVQDLETVRVDLEEPVAWVTLNRPAVKNAMSFQMVRDLRAAFVALRDNRDVRCIVLSGEGGTFCAGGDINELAVVVQDEEARQTQAAADMDTMLRAVNTAPQVVIAMIEGAAFGGGLGLVCVSDIAIASEDARFAMPEVHLGLVPAFISPYVIQRIGLTRARELMLTGRRFNGQEASAYGLVHQAHPQSQLDEAVQAITKQVCKGGPNALAACKELIFEVIDKDLDSTAAYRADLLDRVRRSAEAQDGMLAFVQKRPPGWIIDTGEDT